MSDIKLSVGTLVYVSTSLPSTYNVTGFEAINDWVEIGEVESIGEFGGSAQITPFTPLGTGIVKKRKGSIDYGTAALSIGQVSGNGGQALLKDGFDGSKKYDVHSFKIVEETGEVAYFTGLVGSFTKVTNDANAVMMVNCNIELDNKVLSDNYEFFTVAYIAGANGSIIGNANQLVANGNDGSAVYASPAAGYQFSQWSDTSTDNPRQDTNVTANISVTASFTTL